MMIKEIIEELGNNSTNLEKVKKMMMVKKIEDYIDVAINTNIEKEG